MRKYELTIVLDGKATAAKKKSVQERIEKLIKEAKGKTDKVKDLGTKDLAYKIGKSETGAYLMFPLELESESAKEINSKMRVDTEVIRYLLINTEK
ncbi:MAG TPA: 30S ribosomal protein S6 [Patescibacteria group bacterium]|nr:30S ribosomal protein S6 [Patescibacteria group bacterium]